MECTTVGHENMQQAFRSRPLTFKAQTTETGAEWELYNNLGSIRWSPPEITFSDRMEIHWDGSPLILEHHPGPSIGAIWASLPEQKIIFLGDAVVPNQPPFLENATIPAWIESLRSLLQPEYRQHILISGRGGLVNADEIRKQIQFLEQAQSMMQDLTARSAESEETASLAATLLKGFNTTSELETLYHQRLVYGLGAYYIRHFRPSESEETEE
jgi:glyoxylase-like metal-dependent hydrolase (beta-lactamase superfamily II)